MNLAFSCEHMQVRCSSASGSVRPSLLDSSTVLKNSSGWEVLPNELLYNILGRLHFHDLLSCQRLNRRTAEVIQSSLLLPQAYWKQFQPAPLEESYSKEEYDRKTRSWLMEAEVSSELLWLDSLKANRQFPKALFYTVSKTMAQAQYWSVDKKWQIKFKQDFPLFFQGFLRCCRVTQNDCALMFTRKCGRVLHIVTVQNETSLIGIYQIPISFGDVHSIKLSPNGQSLAVVSVYGTVQMIEKEKNVWTKTYFGDFSYAPRSLPDNFLGKTEFSANGQYFLITMVFGSIRVLAQQRNTWVPKMEIDTHCFVQSAHFIPGLSSIAYSCWTRGVVIREIESHHPVVHYPQWDYLHQVSPCGHALAVGSCDALTAVVVFYGGEWRTFSISPRTDALPLLTVFNFAQFSPDGQHLAVVSKQHPSPTKTQSNIRVISFNGTNWQESGYTEYGAHVTAIHFSSDSRSFFVSPDWSPNCSSIHAVFSGRCWQFHDTIVNGVVVRPTCISPDGRTSIDNSYLSSKNVLLLRYRKREWSIVHEIEGYAPGCIEFSPDNRKILVVFKNKIQLLEIKPKNNNRLLAGERT